MGKVYQKTCFVLFLVLINSCQEEVTSDLVFDLIEEMYPTNLEDKYFGLDDSESDIEFDHFIDIYLSDLKDLDSIQMLRRFKEQIKFSNGKEFLYNVNTQRQFSIGLDMEHPDLAGLFKITEPFKISDKEYLVYFALYCGNNCSLGSLVRVSKESEDWYIKDLSLLWGG